MNDRRPPVRCLVEARNLVGESPVWDPDSNCVFWTDVNGFKIQRLRLGTGELKSWNFDEPVCSLSLTSHPDWLLVVLGSRIILWCAESDRRVNFVRPEPNCPFNRLNDGASDPSGSFWVGSMRNNVATDGAELDVDFAVRSGSLYRVTPDGNSTVWDTGFGITNTLVWSPDRRTFYCGCTIQNAIYAYDFDERDSSIRNRRVFAAGSERGLPDGSTIDADGYIWNCRFFGGCILRFAPDGTVETVIELPVSNITNCVFGGPELKTLFITTASLNSKNGELAGSLFCLDTQFAGLPPNRFRLTGAVSKSLLGR